MEGDLVSIFNLCTKKDPESRPSVSQISIWVDTIKKKQSVSLENDSEEGIMFLQQILEAKKVEMEEAAQKQCYIIAGELQREVLALEAQIKGQKGKK
jgi:hypothetical protein